MSIDIFLVHGVEEKLDAKSYYSDFVLAIRKKLPIDLEVNFHPVNWSVLLEDKQKTIFGMMKDAHYQRLAYFGCTVAADVLAYANTKRTAAPGDFYFDVHNLFQCKFDAVSSARPNSKKIVIAHSQGTQISLDFLWDNPAELFISMGSPILFGSVRYKDLGYPPPQLKRWINIRNRFDPISTPIHKNCNFKFVEDFIVSSTWPINWLPIRAHTYYWRSNKVIDLIAKSIIELSEPNIP